MRGRVENSHVYLQTELAVGFVVAFEVIEVYSSSTPWSFRRS